MSSPLSGFTAVPNPQMLAFMPIQSYLMMYFAGAGWQIGKRKISAIPNTEFNKMSANDLLKGFTADLRETIPTLERSMNDVTPLIKVLIEQYGDFVREAIKALPEAIGNIFQQSGQLGQGQITNVRLSQGSQESARDRELYAGGPSLYEQDIQRQQQREVVSTAAANAARAREIALRNAAARERNERAEELLRQVPIVPQIPLRGLNETPAGRRAAGQSQILERLKLIKEISASAARINNPRNRPQQIAAEKINLRRLQQLLTNLLARYRFN